MHIINISYWFTEHFSGKINLVRIIVGSHCFEEQIVKLDTPEVPRKGPVVKKKKTFMKKQ